MIGRMMVLEFGREKRTALLKIGLPFIVVIGAGLGGYAGFALAMLLVFTGLIGAGMSIVKLKTSGMYDRLIASPVRKSDLFLEIATAQTAILLIQYLPAIEAAVFFTSAGLIFPAVLSLLLVVVIGIIIGIASSGLGSMHLNATLAVLPLLVAVVIPVRAARILPFQAIVSPGLTLPEVLLPVVSLIAMYCILVTLVSRL